LAEPTPVPTEGVINNEWGVDGDDSSHPSTEHRERITWHLAPSRILIRPSEERYCVSYDIDLLPFQAGSYASDEEETDYLETNLDGELIEGVKLEVPKGDEDLVETTKGRPGLVYSTDRTYTASLAIQQGSTVRACESAKDKSKEPQAAIDTSEDTGVVEVAPEIEFEFRDEPIIELSSYY